MDAQYQDLPPLKRLRLMQRDLEAAQQQQLLNQPEAKSLQLPAKKRKQTRVDYDDDAENSNPTYHCLPAKKRIWAIDPDLLSGNPFSPFDLNVEYKPPSVEEKSIEKKSTLMVESSLEVEDDDDDKENVDPLGKEKVLDLSDREVEDEDGIMCVVCQSTDGDPSNPIVFCDGCDLMVHASCYGNPLVKAIPEGDWFCRQCISSKNREKLFSCCLCTTKGGAMKPTNDGRWAHITCALFVPEVYFEDPEGREGICCREIPSKRWKDRCYLCKVRRGCVIECSEMRCKLAFHVTCGLKEDLCIEYREDKKSGGIVVGFCNEHTKLWERESGKYKIVARDEDKK
ncbi:protein Jade-1 isoform X2 [Arabidopsis lyrata subsp. lyrata]|uniref:protein Jade-1 isoform X2 n=1 Tax=Arabidopsis lyrata subsp. lyrata TaxID=81972 RepID=UPI000A29A8DF|nr:protein Jade-1 isoform X2 [Arabidopsis lyrata subsp. lyrata]|eukprot:XP_020886336.1 protein Jade-1 isoform X2 [Arabidopsis lyrata subsp. lyrata]